LSKKISELLSEKGKQSLLNRSHQSQTSSETEEDYKDDLFVAPVCLGQGGKGFVLRGFCA
jgi:hypothetical protein